MSNALRKGKRKRIVTTQAKLMELKDAYITDCMGIFSVAAIKAYAETHGIKPITDWDDEDQVKALEPMSKYCDKLFGIIQYLQKDKDALLKYKKQMEDDYGLSIRIDYDA